MGKKGGGFFWVSPSSTSLSVCWASNGGGGDLGRDNYEEDDEAGDESEADDDGDEYDEEISGSASVLPERWDVLGLGQAMVILLLFFFFFLKFESCFLSNEKLGFSFEFV